MPAIGLLSHETDTIATYSATAVFLLTGDDEKKIIPR